MFVNPCVLVIVKVLSNQGREACEGHVLSGLALFDFSTTIVFSTKSSNRSAADITLFGVLLDCSSRRLAYPWNHLFDVHRIVRVNQSVEILLGMDSKSSKFFSDRFRLICSCKVVDQN